MLGELVPCGGGDPIPLLKPKLVVGRKSFCEILLPFPNVSSRHCELQLTDGYWHVRDLGSTNGTRVNGEPVEAAAVMPGAELAFGRYRYTIHYTSDAESLPTGPTAKRETVSEGLLAKAGIAADGTDKRGGASRPSSRKGAFGELVPCGGGQPIPLLKPRLDIGRHGRCDIPLRYPTVSSRHCELEFRDGYWFAHDMGSRNGIKVNDQRCDSKCLLPGDILAVAQLRFKIEYTPLSDAPPPEEKVTSRSLLDKAGLQRRRD